MASNGFSWQDVASDPDPVDDLGYEGLDLDVIQTTAEGRQQVLMMPTEEDLLHEDAFLVVDEDVVRDLESMA